MKKETYNGWTIHTEREDGLCDYVARRFKFGNYGWMSVTIQKELNKPDTYYLSIVASDPFQMNNISQRLRTHVNDDNYHALIDEANDVIRCILTEIHGYILTMINDLPEI